MSYQLMQRDVAERRQVIDHKCVTAPKETFFQSSAGPLDLPVIHIELSLAVYRMENYRTQIQQRTVARTRQFPKDYFKTGQENLGAQQAQHEILVAFAKEGSGDKIIPIYDVLRSTRLQTVSLLITRDGVVVNGNRRLAAMRELYGEDPETYAGFAGVRAQVLPAGLTEVEIKRIETRLQMTPATLLPYDWCNEALAIRDLRALGLADQEIAAEMKLENGELVPVLLERLAEGELYLSEHLQRAEQYELIIPHKQQFIELQKALKDVGDDVVQKELTRHLCYVLTDNADQLGRRVYDYRIAFAAERHTVVKELSERLGVAQEEVEERPLPATPGDLFDDGSDPLEAYQPLLSRLNDLSQTKAIAEEITEICDTVRESRRAHDKSQTPQKNASKANTLLQEVVIADAAPVTFPTLKAQLLSIIRRANELTNAISQRETGQ